MLTSKEIMLGMMEGDEWVNAIMPLPVYHQIQNDVQEQMAITVHVKNNHYDKCETYRKLSKDLSKARKKLNDYEYDLNNGNTSK